MTPSPYDAFAWFYDRYWATPFQEWQTPALERLLLRGLPPKAHILDLCCGAGHLARRLVDCGFQVTGVDSSEGMLNFARRNAPDAEFISQNATGFDLPQPVDAAVCTFDSINHILRPEDVLSSFRSVRRNLKPGGWFVCDLNTDAAYGPRWDQSATQIEPDHAFFIRGSFDRAARVGHTEVTLFRLIEHWERSDVSFRQRPWSPAELEPLLRQAGFLQSEHYGAAQDLGLQGHYGLGRVYLRAC